MIDGHAGYFSDEFEVAEMFLVTHATERIYLQRVIIHGRVFEKTIVRIEHFFGQQEEPFTSKTTIIYVEDIFNTDLKNEYVRTYLNQLRLRTRSKVSFSTNRFS